MALLVFVVPNLSRPISLYPADSSIKAEELVAKHLEAIGSADARAAVKTRVVQGAAVYRIVVGGGGRQEGKTGLVSEGQKVRFMVKFPQQDYRGENVVFNGDAMRAAFANSNQSRSPLASFLLAQDVIVREGLLSGTLSTAWPLLNVGDGKPKLTVEGLKKVDGVSAYQVRYEPRKRSDLDIFLYFDQETFRHIKTVYSISMANNVGASITESAKLQADRTRVDLAQPLESSINPRVAERQHYHLRVGSEGRPDHQQHGTGSQEL
jgi:hypothetical protein